MRRWRHLHVLGVDVSALGKERVDEVVLNVVRRQVERGLATLRWGGGEAVGGLEARGVTMRQLRRAQGVARESCVGGCGVWALRGRKT
jgi:hypothetical protein